MDEIEFSAIQDGIISAINEMCNFRYNGRKMTVNRLAAYSGVSRSCLLSILRADTDNVGIKTLWKLCRVSGINLSDFFADIENAVSFKELKGAEPTSLADLAQDNPYINDNYKVLQKSIREYIRNIGNASLSNRYREDAIISCKQISGYLKALEDLNIISENASVRLNRELSNTLDNIQANMNSRIEEELRKILDGECYD